MNNGTTGFFKIDAHDRVARATTLTTDRGTIETPAFMAVGTLGGVKSTPPEMVADTGIQVMLGNTYHLLLRPGAEVIAELGGLHHFAAWDRPMLTDSGGFQVFSLSKLAETNEQGVTFQSHIDGKKIQLTPEVSMQAQIELGADIAMQFDDVPALPAAPERNNEAMERSLRWAKRCRDAHIGRSQQGKAQRLFGIQQGGLNDDLRKRSIDGLVGVGFDGYAIGGLSVGESQRDMHAAFQRYAPMLPEDASRYVMGIGYPEDVLAAIEAGIDIMDCVLPTRCARHGMALTRFGRMHLKNSSYARDDRPIDPDCSCSTCARFSRGYLRHLVKSGELLANTLITVHNLAYYAELTAKARSAILAGEFEAYAAACRAGWNALDSRDSAEDKN